MSLDSEWRAWGSQGGSQGTIGKLDCGLEQVGSGHADCVKGSRGMVKWGL